MIKWIYIDNENKINCGLYDEFISFICLFNPFNIPIITDTCVCEPSTKLKNSRYGMFMQVAANPCNGIPWVLKIPMNIN